MFDIAACYVEREADGDYRLHWRGSRSGQRIAVYMADTPDPYYAGEHPGTPLLHYDLAGAYAQSGDILKAQAAYRKVIELDPDSELADQARQAEGKLY